MDNKKIVTVAVLAVLALAFAGYGYADYTASTYNADNSIEVNYITVTPDNWAAIAAAQEIDIETYTYNEDGTTTTLFEFVDLELPEQDGYVQIGTDRVLTITNDTGITFSKYTIDVSVLGTITQGDDLKVYLVLNYGEDDVQYVELDNSMTFDNIAADATSVTFGLYLEVNNIETIEFPDAAEQDGWKEVTGTTSVPPVGPVLSGPDAGANDPNTDDDETGAVFIFKVTGVEQV